MKTETKYNKVVNYDEETGEITVLYYTFNHNDNFKGATGTRFEIVSKDEYDAMMSEDNVIERLIDCYVDGIPKEFKRGGFNHMYADMDDDERESFMFDTSYSELWDYLREELNLTEDEAYIFNCVGGGRCFDKDFQGNVNPELSEIIREFEAQ